MDEDPSGDDISDSEILERCEHQLNEMGNMEVNWETGKETSEGEIRVAEKRKEREDDHSVDEFITVIRSKPKRLIRSDSVDVNDGKEKDKGGTRTTVTTANHVVCVTSMENLPKPIAMAKLLRSENIKDILNIKYKSVYKMLIQFQRKDDANKLIECKKFKDMGLRCQLVQEMSTTYGIVKGIDLELSEEELLSIFNANVEVLSVKRLKRLQSEGKWIDCESVRVSFKGNMLPQHIYAYGCRLKVEPYVFPVTQCSGCWKFGHIIKYCPTKKVLCPKCGGNHENCTIKDFKCLNCKGNHFVLDKTCPVFLKEKTIRIIMSEKQVTYRTALQLFMETRKELNTEAFLQRSNNTLVIANTDKETYRDVLVRAVVHQQPIADMEEEEVVNQADLGKKENTEVPKQKRAKKVSQKVQNKTVVLEEQKKNEDKCSEENGKEGSMQSSQWLKSFEWMKIWIKIKSLYKSELKMEEKLLSTLKIIWEELKNFLVRIIFGENVSEYLSFNNG